MELYVLTYVEELQFEPGSHFLIGVFDNLTDVIAEAKEHGFEEYRDGKGNCREGFYSSAKENFSYAEYLHLQRVSLNEPVEEED